MNGTKHYITEHKVTDKMGFFSIYGYWLPVAIKQSVLSIELH